MKIDEASKRYIAAACILAYLFSILRIAGAFL